MSAAIGATAIARMVTGRVVGVSPAVGRSSVGMGVAVATVEPGVGVRSPFAGTGVS